MQKTVKDGNTVLFDLLTKTKEVITHSDQYLAITRSIQSVSAAIAPRLVVKQNNVEDSAMSNIQTVTVTFHINEETGNIVNATRYDGSPGLSRVPQGEITDSQAIVVSRNSPYCVNVKIGGQWYCI